MEDFDNNVNNELSKIVQSYNCFKAACTKKLADIAKEKEEKQKALAMISQKAQQLKKFLKCNINGCKNSNINTVLRPLTSCTHIYCPDCYISHQVVLNGQIIVKCSICK